MVRIPFLAICAMGVVVASTAGASDDPQQIGKTYGVGAPYGGLQVREHFDPKGGIPIEGYIPFVVVRRAESGRVVLRAQPPFRGTLHRGRYRVSSYMRTCSANCGYLDAPSNRCAASFHLEGGKINRLTIRRLADRPCELRMR